MSFSSDVKDELCFLDIEQACCQKAELAGLFAFCGTFLPESAGGGLRLRTENAAVSFRMRSLLLSLFSANIPVFTTQKKSQGNIYTLLLPYTHSSFLRIMKSLGFYRDERLKFCIDPFVTGQSCCRRAFMRGAFLAGGSVSAPEKSYHLEIETHYKSLAHDLLQLFSDEQMRAREVVRKANYVIYMKDSEEIADALAAFGATDSALSLYNIKIEKDMKNKINRQMNCENANMNKTADAFAIHSAAIRKVLSSPYAAELSPAVLELAELRLKEPEASLAQLGEMLTDPISKSGVSRRLKKLVELSELIK